MLAYIGMQCMGKPSSDAVHEMDDAPTKAETLAGLKEIIPVLERHNNLLTKAITENAIEKSGKIPEPECSRFIASL